MSTIKTDDTKDVALDALTNLIRLMGAELVAGRHRDDINLLEHAMREKLASTVIEGCSPEIAAAGLDIARQRVELALVRVRAQAGAAKNSDQLPGNTQQECAAPILH